VILKDTWRWTFPIYGSRNVRVDNVKIVSARCENNDGIGIVNSRDVAITNCFIRSDDDCITTKGNGYPERDKYKDGDPVEDVTVSQCVLWTDRAHILRLGCESWAEGMRRLTFRDIDVIHYVDRNNPAIFIQPAEDMIMEDVVIEDFRINGEGQEKLIEIHPAEPYWFARWDTCGNVRRVRFADLVVSGNAPANTGSIVVRGCGPDHTVRDVRFENVVRYGSQATATSPNIQIGNHTHGIVFTPTTDMNNHFTIPTGYPVTYNTNGATGGAAPASQTKTQDVPLTLATNSGNLVRTGFTFAGWNTAANGLGRDYVAGESYTANVPVTLYAKWGANPEFQVWWKFDETSGMTAFDANGNNNPGTLTGMAGTEWTAGKSGNALSFDGVNGYVTRESLSANITGASTISLWMKRTGNPSVAERLVCLGTAAGGSAWGSGFNIYVNSSGYVAIDNNGGLTSNLVASGVQVTDGAWHHIVATRSGTAPYTFKIYVDGVLKGTDNNPNNTLPALKRLRVGAAITPPWVPPGSYFNGLIDDVRVYSRALSGTEIQGL
jgi:uncharacterized repeat protein (TIGR02543 family)